MLYINLLLESALHAAPYRMLAVHTLRNLLVPPSINMGRNLFHTDIGNWYPLSLIRMKKSILYIFQYQKLNISTNKKPNKHHGIILIKFKTPTKLSLKSTVPIFVKFLLYHSTLAAADVFLHTSIKLAKNLPLH